MFVRWSCGCVGLIVDDPRGEQTIKHCWIVGACDDNCSTGSTLTFFERDTTESLKVVLRRQEVAGHKVDWAAYTEEQLNQQVMKDYTPLPYKKVCQLLVDVGELMADGYSFRSIHSILNNRPKHLEVEICAQCGSLLNFKHRHDCPKAKNDYDGFVRLEECEGHQPAGRPKKVFRCKGCGYESDRPTRPFICPECDLQGETLFEAV